MLKLILVQVFLAVGIGLVNVMVVAIQLDYPADESRGKLGGFAGVAIGLGALSIGVVLTRRPFICSQSGATELMAGRYTMFTMTGIGIVTALIVGLGLKGGRPPHAKDDQSLQALIASGISAGSTRSDHGNVQLVRRRRHFVYHESGRTDFRRHWTGCAIRSDRCHQRFTVSVCFEGASISPLYSPITVTVTRR